MQNDTTTNKAKINILDKPIPKTKGDVYVFHVFQAYWVLKMLINIFFSSKG